MQPRLKPVSSTSAPKISKSEAHTLHQTTTCYLHSRIFSPITSRNWHLKTAREGKTGSNKRRYENDRKYTTGHRTNRQSRTDKYGRERDPKQEDGDYERAQERRMNGVINKRWNVNTRLHSIIFFYKGNDKKRNMYIYFRVDICFMWYVRGSQLT